MNPTPGNDEGASPMPPEKRALQRRVWDGPTGLRIDPITGVTSGPPSRDDGCIRVVLDAGGQADAEPGEPEDDDLPPPLFVPAPDADR
jgi:hypothetical protein